MWELWNLCFCWKRSSISYISYQVYGPMQDIQTGNHWAKVRGTNKKSYWGSGYTGALGFRAYLPGNAAHHIPLYSGSFSAFHSQPYAVQRQVNSDEVTQSINTKKAHKGGQRRETIHLLSLWNPSPLVSRWQPALKSPGLHQDSGHPSAPI